MWLAGALMLVALPGLCSPKQLEIYPLADVHEKAEGSNVMLTCLPKDMTKEHVKLLTDMKWLNPRNETIKDLSEFTGFRPRTYTEYFPHERNLVLFINSMNEADSGTYTCTATYANTEKLYRSAHIKTYIPITWQDAEGEQYANIHSNAQIRCKVHSRPPPSVDWKKGNDIIEPTGRYTYSPDGLRISNVSEADDGTYVCRAIVRETGMMEVRNIKFQVVILPVMSELMETKKEVIEGEVANINCSATGKPPPEYRWIRKSTHEDLSEKSRFKVDKISGRLIINPVEKDDQGEYLCEAENRGGKKEKIVKIVVLVKPQIGGVTNMSVPITKTGRVECIAKGRPHPDITFRRPNGPEFRIGSQDDGRIVVENLKDDKNDETKAVLEITDIIRTDDGLYECIATNKIGTAMKMAHLTVEFPPSFGLTPQKEVWSWEKHKINLTCLAESIPNATIKWFFNGQVLFRNDKDSLLGYEKFGNGPVSSLVIETVRGRYGSYRCKARNIHGEAEHIIELKEAHVPSQILQVKMEVITATTITFNIFGPRTDGGLPTKVYAVQYKMDTEKWEDARNRTWPADSSYILENLQPTTTYNFRFAAQNDVGFGPWGGDLLKTMPKRSAPEEPTILREGTEDSDVVRSAYPDRYELSWKVPADNGEPIDHYSIEACEVIEGSNAKWEDTKKNCISEEISKTETSYQLMGLLSDIYYKIELRAHNSIGYSPPGQAIIRTAKGKEVIPSAGNLPALSSGAIISIVVATLVIFLIMIDLTCCIVNRAGIIMAICEKTRSKSNEADLKPSSDEKELLRERQPQPILHGAPKRDTTVEYDMKKSVSRTSFVGKDSAV